MLLARTYVTDPLTGRHWFETQVDPTFLGLGFQDACARLRELVREEASRRIEALWPDWKQRSAAIGVYGERGLTACRECIAAHRACVDRFDAAIAAATDFEALMAIDFENWPLGDS